VDVVQEPADEEEQPRIPPPTEPPFRSISEKLADEFKVNLATGKTLYGRGEGELYPKAFVKQALADADDGGLGLEFVYDFPEYPEYAKLHLAVLKLCGAMQATETDDGFVMRVPDETKRVLGLESDIMVPHRLCALLIKSLRKVEQASNAVVKWRLVKYLEDGHAVLIEPDDINRK